MAFGNHLRNHGAIHASWLFGGMALVIAALLLTSPNGALVNDYISFASSLASLILAVVAIFYSIIANQDVTKNIGALAASAQEMNNRATAVGALADTLSQATEKILTEFSTFGPTVEEISNKIDRSVLPQPNSGGSSESAELPLEDSGIIKDDPAMATLLTLYIVAKTHLRGVNKVSIERMFVDNQVWDNFCSGCMDTIKTLRPCGIVLNKFGGEKNESGRVIYYYSVQDLGSFKATEVLEYIARVRFPSWTQYQSLVDNYIESVLNADEQSKDAGSSPNSFENTMIVGKDLTQQRSSGDTNTSGDQ